MLKRYHIIRRCFSYNLESDTVDKFLRVALVGRPNTGKSTLFNRLTKSNFAIVSPIPGTTRDRNVAKGDIAGLNLIVTDTGGLDDRGHIHENVQSQVDQAIKSSDVILFLVDAKEGVTSLDSHFANWIRRRLSTKDRPSTDSSSKSNDVKLNKSVKKEVLLLANKTEGAHLSDRVLDTISDVLQLGLGDPILISASHGDGMADLAHSLIEIAKSKGLDTENVVMEKGKKPKISLEERVIEMAIMGKPNVGKSSLINAILKEERVIVGPTPGLTRDAIQVEWKYMERTFKLVDTAGLLKISPDKKLLASGEEKRRLRHMETTGRFDKSLPGVQLMDPEEDPSQFSQQVSELALISALSALRFAQVVVLVVEGGQTRFSKVDLQIAHRCAREGRSLVIAANKADLVEQGGLGLPEYEESVKKHCEKYMREFGEVRVVACCAADGRGVERLVKEVIAVHDAWSKRFSTWVLNRWLTDLMVSVPVPRSGGRAINIKYITQVKARPPTFALFCNVTQIPPTFQKFLSGRAQRALGLQGVPVRLVVRKTAGRKTQRSLLRRTTKKQQTRWNNSSRPVGPKRTKNKFLLVKATREKRRARRKIDKKKSRLRR